MSARWGLTPDLRGSAIEIARAMRDDGPETLSERHALADCDGHLDHFFGPDETHVNVYYWVTRDGGRLVKPVFELEAYDAETGEPYEFSEDEELDAIGLAELDWIDQTAGLADYYRDDI